ncbi:MAG: ribulose-phosphate 3-epimerase [Epsilonproteobacteria bacterium]|nr:ribulose-phosphate 3-epimerase [Campylobacterota bacterium]
MEIYPSLISSDLLNIKTTLELLDPHVHGYHIDVMDDHFVPNLTWGPAFINAIRQATQLPLHIHYMVDNPEAWIGRHGLYQNDTALFHYESFSHDSDRKAFFSNIKTHSKHQIGIVINPETPIQNAFPYLQFVDNVLIMSVQPGFSGQSFMPEVMGKVSPLLEERKSQQHTFIVSMDGGINTTNIAQLAKNGVEQVGMANALFGQDDPVKACNELYRLTQ